jgi:hypothetical protein
MVWALWVIVFMLALMVWVFSDICDEIKKIRREMRH